MSMNTPDTEAGQMTEEIMHIVKVSLPKISIAEYNEIWVSVLKYLEMFPKLRDTPTNIGEEQSE